MLIQCVQCILTMSMLCWRPCQFPVGVRAGSREQGVCRVKEEQGDTDWLSCLCPLELKIGPELQALSLSLSFSLYIYFYISLFTAAALSTGHSLKSILCFLHHTLSLHLSLSLSLSLSRSLSPYQLFSDSEIAFLLWFRVVIFQDMSVLLSQGFLPLLILYLSAWPSHVEQSHVFGLRPDISFYLIGSSWWMFL